MQCTCVLWAGEATRKVTLQEQSPGLGLSLVESGFTPSQKPQGQSDHMDLQEEKKGADQPSWFPLSAPLARQLSDVLCSDGVSALVLQSTWLPQSSIAFVLLKVELLQDALVNKGKLEEEAFPIWEGAWEEVWWVTHTMPAQQLQELAGGND